ncbi:AlbA family DNA-binding domain-containing protein [Hymenobacter defluvii]|uniref:ATP-binding protein n=1 Tax=Hymenobacter defluvii TaxID=2054411 RepID=A0ABS3TI88_9BACT|nr:ATP-binding protein [Hymenobacter defluvii]MBO3273380.1 ATP-binding protein [Hymenobacter defluvii]
MTIQEIILHEAESTTVDFKATAYKPASNPEFIKDVLAMANAQVPGDRYLIVGVKHNPDNTREILGVPPADQLDDANYHKAILENIEPEIPFTYSYVEVEGKQVGVFRIHSVDDPPYMMRKDSAILKIGHSVIRKGTSTFNLRRADIDRMFAQRQAADPFAGKIDVQLVIDGQKATSTHTCSEAIFPSEVARQKILSILNEKREKRQRYQEMLEKRNSTNPILQGLYQQLQLPEGLDLSSMGRIGQLGPSRYEDLTIEELEKNLLNVKSTYREHDLYAKFEEQAHKLNFILFNDSEQYVEDCSLTVRLPNDAGVSIATKIIDRPETKSAYSTPTARFLQIRYASVQQNAGEYLIRDSIKSLKHGVKNYAFQEPLRVFVPQQASGRQLRFHLTLTAKNLRKPVNKEVVLTIR